MDAAVLLADISAISARPRYSDAGRYKRDFQEYMFSARRCLCQSVKA